MARCSAVMAHNSAQSHSSAHLAWRVGLVDRARWAIVCFALAVLVLLATDVLLLSLHSPRYTLDVGTYRAGYFWSGIYEPESGGDGTSYRWTSPRTVLLLEQSRLAPDALLVLALGGRPEPVDVQLTLDDQPWLTFPADTLARTYSFVLPPTPSRTLRLGIQSATFTPGGDDTRQLGIKIERVALEVPGAGVRLPLLPMLLAQIGLLGVVLLLLLRLGWGWRVATVTLTLSACILAGLLAADLFSAYPFVMRLLGAAGVLLLVTLLGLPLALRFSDWVGGAGEMTLLWSLMLLACAVRFAGTLNPTFGGQDQFLHLKLLREVTEGQLIHAIVASEFGGGLALYPPTTYLALAPGRLFIFDPVALLQGGLALLDGMQALLVALLARRLGGNRQAGYMALMLYAGSQTAFTAMSYGFSAQIFGQCLVAPVALALMAGEPPLSRRAWLAASLFLLLAVASHVGVALLASVWVGIVLLLMLTRPHRNMLWGFGVLVACAVFAFLALYIDGIGIMLGNFGRVGTGGGFGPLPGATPLLWVGFLAAYSPLGVALIPFGLWRIARAHEWPQARLVALAWVAATLLFLMVDLLLALQVRYFYFFLPLALVAIALALGALAERGRWGMGVAWALTAAIALQGTALWFAATFGDGKLSLTPLTH